MSDSFKIILVIHESRKNLQVKVTILLLSKCKIKSNTQASNKLFSRTFPTCLLQCINDEDSKIAEQKCGNWAKFFGSVLGKSIVFNCIDDKRKCKDIFNYLVKQAYFENHLFFSCLMHLQKIATYFLIQCFCIEWLGVY